jgi:two-component system, LuxR family, sensor kinase FixL
MTTGIAEIADEKQAQRWLRLMRFSVENAADAIFWVGRDSRLIYANAHAVRTLGYSREELLSLSVADFDPLFPLNEWPKVWDNLRQEGFLAMESIHRRKDGSEFPVWVSAVFYADGETEVSFACCRDISEKKAAEQALRRANEELEQRVSLRTAELAASEARFQELYHNAPDMFRSVDCRTGKTIQCNQTMSRATGYSREELLSQQITDLYHPDSRAAAQLVWEEFIRTGTIRDRELVLLCKNGDTIDISLSVSAAYDSQGNITQSHGIFRDITAYKRAEQQVERHRSELAHVGRLATTGEMAAGLAHELNQPLYALNNFAQGALRRLEAGTLDKESLESVLQDVSRESQRAADTIRSLRRYVRKREQQRLDADANEMVRRVLRIVASESKRREVAIKTTLADRLHPVNCDPIQIEQVMLNLILNAFDAMAEQASEGRRLSVRTRCSGAAAVEFAIADRGTGLPIGEENKIFDAFYTTKDDGIGLGLAISRTIVEAHGGQLVAAPNSECGVTMSFSLPSLRTKADL